MDDELNKDPFAEEEELTDIDADADVDLGDDDDPMWDEEDAE